MFFEQLLIDPWFIVKSFHKAQRYQLAKIAVALSIHREQNEVVVVFPIPLIHSLSFKSACRRHIDLTADNRLDTVPHGL